MVELVMRVGVGGWGRGCSALAQQLRAGKHPITEKFSGSIPAQTIISCLDITKYLEDI